MALFVAITRFAGPSVLVPAGIQRQPVVREDVGPLLCLGEVVENDDGNLLELELSRSEEATVACDDAGLGTNQYRVIETEFGDAGGDLRDLGVRVCPGISGSTG